MTDKTLGYLTVGICAALYFTKGGTISSAARNIDSLLLAQNAKREANLNRDIAMINVRAQAEFDRRMAKSQSKQHQAGYLLSASQLMV